MYIDQNRGCIKRMSIWK